MTDGKLVSVMRRIYRLNERIRDLLGDLSEHPNGEALLAELHENGAGYSWDFEIMVHSHLVHPDRWEYVRGGRLKWKAAEAAKGE